VACYTGGNPFNPAPASPPAAGTLLNLWDLNGDGVVNYDDQMILHAAMTDRSAGADADCNNDGIVDFVEVNEDLDDDGRLDQAEDLNGNGLFDLLEDLNNNDRLDAGEDLNRNGRLDTENDLDGDGRPDPFNEDADGSGRLRSAPSRLCAQTGETCTANAQCVAGDVCVARATNPNNPDTDGDGLCDGSRSVVRDDTNGNGRQDQGEVDRDGNGAFDLNCRTGESLDNDQVVDRDGFNRRLETDPLVADTDGDLVTDGIEVRTSALDTDSDDDGLTDGAEDNAVNAALNVAMGLVIVNALVAHGHRSIMNFPLLNNSGSPVTS
jgi:hypothetical protein